MKRQIIRLTENDLHNLIMESVNAILSERHVIKAPHSNNDMGGVPPMPPIGGANSNDGMPQDPMLSGDMGADPNGVDPNMMGDEENNDPTNELQSTGGKMANQIENGDMDSTIIKGAVNQILQAYKKKATGDDVDDSIKILQGDDSDDNDNSDNNDGGMGNMPNMPMESRRINLDEILSDIIQKEQPRKREEKKITNKRVDYSNPFVSNR